MHIGIAGFQIRCRRVVLARPVQPVDNGHFFISQGKIEDVEIAAQMVRVLRAGNGDELPLDSPAQDNLYRTLVILIGQCRKNRVAEQFRVTIPNGYKPMSFVPYSARRAMISS